MKLLEPDERLLWSGQPDPFVTFRTQLFIWWIAAIWLAGVLLLWMSGKVDGTGMLPLLLLPAALIPAPLMMVFLGMNTFFGITDRRAIIDYDALGYAKTFSVKFSEMDETPEILPVGKDGGGHLYFASGYKVKSPYLDYKGKLAFRGLKDPAGTAAVLERARREWKDRAP